MTLAFYQPYFLNFYIWPMQHKLASLLGHILSSQDKLVLISVFSLLES